MKKYILSLAMTLCLSACNYLDVVPDERTSHENAYETPAQVLNYLYSCYAYQPKCRDILTNAYYQQGGETTYWRGEAFSKFYEGAWSPSSPDMTTETWGPIWDGIRRCYLFLSIIDETTHILTPAEIRTYKAEATFLIAYYHFISLRSYGPTLIVDKLLPDDMPVSELPERSSVEKVVAFIDQKIEESLEGLELTFSGDEYGRATRYAALGLRSRLYLYAASPLFNGQDSKHADMYADFKDSEGNLLISKKREEAKWQKSVEVSRGILQELLDADFHLYDDEEAGAPDASKPSLTNKAQRRLRYSTMDYPNNSCEVLWAYTRAESSYGIQRRSMPRQSKGSHVSDPQGGIVPTLATVESFYSKNGLPMDRDKEFDYANRYDVVTLPYNYDGNGYGESTDNSRKTAKMHLNREPRFYAFVGFHNGFAEISKFNGANTSTDPKKRAVRLQMLNSQEQGRLNRTANYSVSGYNNKKLAHPAYSDGYIKYPLPLFRLAEIYLNLAESLIELGGDANLQEAKGYIDVVRKRAGIPGVDEAWNFHSDRPGYQNTQNGLRDIVRRERMLEFYIEGHKFFDTRRWMIAEEHYNVPEKGLYTLGETEEEFFRPVTIEFVRKFHKGQYLMPIPAAEVNKAPQIVQNPYYN